MSKFTKFDTKRNSTNGFTSNTTRTTNNSSFNNKNSSYSKPERFTSSHHQKQQYVHRKRNPNDDDVNMWIESIGSNNFDEVVSVFEAKKLDWEDKMGDLLKKLTREHKFEVLDYVLKHFQSSTSNTNKHKITLLNENVWFGKKNIIDETQDENIIFYQIIKTFDVLISNGYNFIDFSLLNNETMNKSEILRMFGNPQYFYQSIMKKSSKIPENLHNDINQYMLNRLGVNCANEFLNVWEKNSNVQTTIAKMVNDYYTDENLINVRLKQTESFLGAILNSKNKISPSLRNRLYDYFTKIYWDKEHFVSCLRIMFNKITESNSLLFIDNMQFILSRNVDIMTQEIFKLIVSRESTNITERNIISSLFSNLIGREDLGIYFESINIDFIKETFLSNIIVNYSEWIEHIIRIQQSSNPDVELNEFRTNNYGVLMMIFGIAYSKGFKKNQILSVVSNIIESTDINLIKPFGVFIETSNISNVELTEQEYQIISKYITKFYFNQSYGFREKSIIETILSNFASQSKKYHIDVRKENIDTFLSTGLFVKITSKTKSVSGKKNVYAIKSNNTFSGLETDDESDEELINVHDVKLNKMDLFDEIDEIDYPEPDEKVLKNINIYFKSNDKEASFDDLKYFIEKSKTELNKFVCGLLYSLGERTPTDIFHIKELISQINLISGFELIVKELEDFIKINPGLIDMLKCDNPKLMEIINSIN